MAYVGQVTNNVYGNNPNATMMYSTHKMTNNMTNTNTAQMNGGLINGTNNLLTNNNQNHTNNNGNNNNNHNNNNNSSKPDGKATYQLPAGVTDVSQLNDFFMFKYRVDPCPLKRNCPNKATCSGWHHEQERRRNPKSEDGDYRYSEEPCTAVRNTSNSSKQKWNSPSICENGDNCTFTHTLMEQMYHPNIYKTSMCHNFQSPTGNHCQWGYYCTHAHGSDDIRNPNKKFINNTPNDARQIIPNNNNNNTCIPVKQNTNMQNVTNNTNQNKIRNRPDRANSFSGATMASAQQWRTRMGQQPQLLSTLGQKQLQIGHPPTTTPQTRPTTSNTAYISPDQSSNLYDTTQTSPSRHIYSSNAYSSLNMYHQPSSTTDTAYYNAALQARIAALNNTPNAPNSMNPNNNTLQTMSNINNNNGTIPNSTNNNNGSGYTPMVTYETPHPYTTRGRLASRSDPPPYFNPHRGHHTTSSYYANLPTAPVLKEVNNEDDEDGGGGGGINNIINNNGMNINTRSGNLSGTQSHSHSQSSDMTGTESDKHTHLTVHSLNAQYGTNTGQNNLLRPLTPPAPGMTQHGIDTHNNNNNYLTGNDTHNTHNNNTSNSGVYMTRERSKTYNPRTDALMAPSGLYTSHTGHQSSIHHQRNQSAHETPLSTHSQHYTNLTTYYDNIYSTNTGSGNVNNDGNNQQQQQKMRNYSHSINLGHPSATGNINNNNNDRNNNNNNNNNGNGNIFTETNIWRSSKRNSSNILDPLHGLGSTGQTDMASTNSSQSNWVLSNVVSGPGGVIPDTPSLQNNHSANISNDKNMSYYLGGLSIGAGNNNNNTGNNNNNINNNNNEDRNNGIISPPPDRPKSLPGTPHPPFSGLNSNNDSKKSNLSSVVSKSNGSGLSPLGVGDKEELMKKITQLQAELDELKNNKKDNINNNNNNIIIDNDDVGVNIDSNNNDNKDESKDEESVNVGNINDTNNNGIDINGINIEMLRKRSQRLSGILTCKICNLEKIDRIYCLDGCGDVICGDCARECEKDGICPICKTKFETIIKLKV